MSLFEEPLLSNYIDGLQLLSQQRPGGVSITAGKSGFDLHYFQRLIKANAVDVLKADAKRCGGVTGFLAIASLYEAFGIPLFSQGAPTIHASLCCAVPKAIHMEYFHDYARIENMFFEGKSNF